MATPSGAAASGLGPRRSARARARRQRPDDEAPPAPAPVAPPPDAGGPSSSPPSRRKRGASPSRRSVRAREKEDPEPPVAALDDDEAKNRMEEDELKKQGKEIVEAEGPEEVEFDENAEALKEAPFWLPDGWIINVRHGDGGSIYRYYTSPVSEYTFSTEMEALDYLFSEMDERILESEACAEDNELHKMHSWLPDGWVVEVRAGTMQDKMYKFYVHLPTGMRFFSKEDVLRYVNEGKISECDVKGLCDTISEDNILAQVEFNPDGLPKGWVKELVFRKCNDGIRKDPYYTDPVSHLLFRTLKSVISYLQTGEISRHAYLPRRSVTDIYSFDGCADLPRKMLKRLKVPGKKKQKSVQSLVFEKKLPDDQTSNRSHGGTSASMNPRSDTKEKRVNTVQAKGKEPISSETTKQGKEPISSETTKQGKEPISSKTTKQGKEPISSETTKQGKEPISSKTTKQGKEPISSETNNQGKEPTSSETTKRPRGRPRKIPKQTNETTSDCAKSSDKETTHIEIASDKEPKKESDTETGENMSKEDAPEDNEMEKHGMATQEVDNESDLARTLSSLRRGSTDPATDPAMRERENGDPAEASAKSTSSAVKKFYMRRNSSQSFKK
ncbi:hypothetical protein CFC21_015116 [Triticum aestivum]|uniref:MBD domain-containing protein n=3 Tax=Triticum TaxID=4564 RepID=A0A9R1R2C4_TRITD|nr:uncharacterized protein LOC123187280 [Triticum aestivum]KAF6999041.1 hypothetical protein CFC21_015116 [Triticum aestivum]VAH25671.1 unnamed protein product [Triticum turgidum subsp. durum]